MYYLMYCRRDNNEYGYPCPIPATFDFEKATAKARELAAQEKDKEIYVISATRKPTKLKRKVLDGYALFVIR